MQASGAMPVRQPAQARWRGVVLPEQLAGFRHHGIHAVRSRRIHDAVHHNGHGLRSGLSRTKCPRSLQPFDVALMNLLQGRISHRTGIVAIGRPIRLGEPHRGEQQHCTISHLGRSISSNSGRPGVTTKWLGPNSDKLNQTKMRQRLALLLPLLLWLSVRGSAQDSAYPPKNQLIPGPACLATKGLGASMLCSESAHQDWLKDVTHWREERRIRTGYDGSRYNNPALRWTQSSFIQPQMMVQDRYFYDPVSRRYTVDRYLDDLDQRYGGIDSVLIWPTYPNMGIDNRNQHDMIRSMPGGVESVKRMIADFHRRGVRVLFPMMMWDQGTRDPGKPWPEAIAELMKEIDADGINGDTQDGVPLAFSLAADKVGHPLAFEPEDGPSDEGLAWNIMTWGQYNFPFVPLVDKYKWLETRPLVNISDRWNRDKTNDLLFAFFNGVGWESWENIWGIWNGITPRDAEAARRVRSLERTLAPFLV